MALYDPYRPYVIGNQFAPLRERESILDTGSEIGYKFLATEDFYQPNNNPTWLWAVMRTPPPGVPDRSEVVCRLYLADPTDTCTPLQKIVIPCSAGSGGSVSSGTPQDAVGNPSNGEYVRLTGASQMAKFWFGTNAQTVVDAFSLWHTEIVDVSVRYVVVGPFGEVETNTMSLGMQRQAGPITRYMDDLVTGPTSATEATEIKRSRFGELCPFWDDSVNPGTEYARGPWVYQGFDDIGLYALSGAGTDDVAVFFETGASAAGDFDIHYVALEVTYRENDRIIGIGGFDLSSGVDIGEGLYAYRCPLMRADLPWDWNGASFNLFALTQGQSYVITISRAYSGNVSLSSPVPLPISTIDTITQTVPGISGVRITKPTAEGSLPVYEETTNFPAIVLFAASPDHWDTQMIPSKVYPGCHAYESQTPQAIHSQGYFNAEQSIPDNVSGTFSWAVFYARAADVVVGTLYLSQTDGAGTFLGPEGKLSYEELIALPEITDGWRKIIIPISPAITLASGGGVIYMQFWTSTDELQIWEILGATANHTVMASGASSGAVAGYYGETAICHDVSDTDNYPMDLTIMLTQDMTEVSNFAVGQEYQPLSVVDECCYVAVDGIPSGIVYNRLTWTAVLTEMVSGWAYYEIQRRDTTMDSDVWEVIAKITNPYVESMDDYEARIGVETSYRIRTVHIIGVVSAWSSEVTSTILAPGVTGTGCDTGLLVFTSNDDPSKNLAYVHGHGSSPSEEFVFIEAGQQSIEPLFLRDYQIALRPAERGGVTFTRTLLVNNACIPDETLDRGFTGLRDMAWNSVPYLCVRDELTNRWLANVTVPSGTIKRVHEETHYAISQVAITEVTGTPQALDIAEPYLGFTSKRNASVGAWMLDLSSFATLEDVEIRIKFIVRESPWYIYMDRYADTPAESSWSIDLSNYNNNTTSFFVAGDDGVFYAEQNIYPIVNQPMWIRMIYDHDAGGGITSTARFYSSLDGTSWTLLSSQNDGPAGLVPETTGYLYIKSLVGSVIQEFMMFNHETGETIASVDFISVEGQTTFTDRAGMPWEIREW